MAGSAACEGCAVAPAGPLATPHTHQQLPLLPQVGANKNQCCVEFAALDQALSIVTHYAVGAAAVSRASAAGAAACDLVCARHAAHAQLARLPRLGSSQLSRPRCRPPAPYRAPPSLPASAAAPRGSATGGRGCAGGCHTFVWQARTLGCPLQQLQALPAQAAPACAAAGAATGRRLSHPPAHIRPPAPAAPRPCCAAAGATS